MIINPAQRVLCNTSLKAAKIGIFGYFLDNYIWVILMMGQRLAACTGRLNAL
ncbi:hypothetical protein [Erwinia tracheiphila]|uniref:hypothetical protein n=1 Tax=Erwinia tracheiphila TaxID=65700 RepID=UPI0003A2A16B|nr:hypothetical protein [Erwinia tracheiphila]UIA84892.1 hypothetical protein LU604_08325 [Erwinia tracheiphila]UIA93488.1 hypothetical protein LU632_08285 [Erwinia tracheiphila]